MAGVIRFEQKGSVAWVTLNYPARFNAMSRHMWRELQAVFEQIQQSTDVRCVVVSGEGAHFCAGGDISEYMDFRFNSASLRDFHERDVWGGLQAMLDCDVPIVAQIRGNCMGAGVEIASCCDLRLASVSSRFGAPIAKLGFPMAPREAALVTRELGATVARQMLLAATLFDATELLSSGFLARVMSDEAVATEVGDLCTRIVALAPAAARLNKQTLRALNNPIALSAQGGSAMDSGVFLPSDPYAYASSAEHREGVTAFMAKRKPVF